MSYSDCVILKGVRKGFSFNQKSRFSYFCSKLFPQYFNQEIDFWAIEDVSLSVGKGECVGLIGRNGAGKSTLLQLIAGVYSPNAGDVSVSGRVASLLELGSGFHPDYTGVENIRISAALAGMGKDEVEKKISSIVEFADIGDFINQPIKTYSSGMAVRLAFAINMHLDADILLIDEALAVGDIFFAQKCMRAIRSLVKEKTVILVTHDMSAISDLCTRVIFLEKGKVKFDGDVKQAIDIYSQENLEFGMTVKAQKPKLESAASSSPSCGVLEEDFRQNGRVKSSVSNSLYFTNNLVKPEEQNSSAIVLSEIMLQGNGKVTSQIYGGELVTLKLIHQSLDEIPSCFIGFIFRDYKGQYLFSDNNYYLHKDKVVKLAKQEKLISTFTFRMPLLLKGKYVLSVVAANGTPEKYEILSWIDDALVLESLSTSSHTGLVGIPMIGMEVEVLNAS